MFRLTPNLRYVGVRAEDAARKWASTWSQAWPAKDVDAIAALYSEAAAYRSHPLRDPYRGPHGAREYVVTTFADEDAIECWFGDPMTSGQRAAVEWWAAFRSENKEWTIIGTTVLRFDEDGKVGEHCDYWVMEEGRRKPPPGWGR